MRLPTSVLWRLSKFVGDVMRRLTRGNVEVSVFYVTLWRENGVVVHASLNDTTAIPYNDIPPIIQVIVARDAIRVHVPRGERGERGEWLN